MTKREFVARVSAEAKLTQKQTKLLINAMCSAVMDALAAGEEVCLKGFGTFEVYTTPERPGRNPKTKAALTIPAGKRVRFKAGKPLKARVQAN